MRKLLEKIEESIKYKGFDAEAALAETLGELSLIRRYLKSNGHGKDSGVVAKAIATLKKVASGSIWDGEK